MARKTIAIGESVLDTVFRDDRPVDSFVGGRIANAAASAASAGVPVEMVSECCNDHIGDIITDFLESHHVGTGSVDRFTDGSTAVSMVFYQGNGGGKKMINFYNYPDDRFDVVWPRIDEDDVVLFGSFYSIDTVMRDRFYELVKYARERKAILIYLLGCQHGISCRITKVMPGILENLEIADIVVAWREELFRHEPRHDFGQPPRMAGWAGKRLGVCTVRRRDNARQHGRRGRCRHGAYNRHGCAICRQCGCQWQQLHRLGICPGKGCGTAVGVDEFK